MCPVLLHGSVGLICDISGAMDCCKSIITSCVMSRAQPFHFAVVAAA